jgi:ABC-2 type transport system ATP-binding protein
MNSIDRQLAIDVADAQKLYKGGLFRKPVHALRGASIKVERGQVFGLLGPNGAGKSTLVKIIMTVIRASHVKGTVLGQPVGTKSALAKVGYLPEHHRFPRYLTGEQVIHLFGGLSGVDRNTLRKRSPELLDMVGMKQWAKTPVSDYSKGMMQRVGIAQALVSDPELLLLDEPTDGVDPIGRAEIRDIVIRLKDQGRTVFLNSHLLSELEMVCDRVAIMVGGIVARQGTLEEIASGRGHYEIDVEPHHFEQAKPLLPEFVLEKEIFKLNTLESSAIQPAIDRLRANRIDIRRVQRVRPTLEDVFMEAVREQYGADGRPVGAKG